MTHAIDLFEEFKKEKTLVVSHSASQKVSRATSYILDGVDVVYMEAKDFALHMKEVLKNISLATASASILGSSYVVLERFNDLSPNMIILALGVAGTLAIPKVLDELKRKIHDIYPATSMVLSRENEFQKEIETHGDAIMVRYDVSFSSEGEKYRQVSCENDWAIITPMKKTAMVNGEKAYLVEVNLNEQIGTSKLMTEDQAIHMVMQGEFGDTAEIRSPTQYDINILKHEKISNDNATIYWEEKSELQTDRKYG